MSRRKGSGGDQPPVSLSGQTVAGRYRVVGTLGQGGIGKVYEAEQIGLDRSVAIKVIRPERRKDDITAKRFLREARAAGRIASPHVVTLFDCGTDEATGELYIAMEMLHGQSLGERISDGAIELSELLRIAAMIARGLRAAHEAGVLHRDLKPANVFLCDDGNVKVLDFGIAKLLDDEPSAPHEALTKVNRILGTPVYMSPEAATRRPLGPTTDLYALGLLLYEMVVGTPPFRTGDAWKTLEAQVKTIPPRLTTAAPWRSVPKVLDDLVAQLLEKNPQKRPRDAGEVATLLDRLATEQAMAQSRQDRTRVEVRLPPGTDPAQLAASAAQILNPPAIAPDVTAKVPAVVSTPSSVERVPDTAVEPASILDEISDSLDAPGAPISPDAPDEPTTPGALEPTGFDYERTEVWEGSGQRQITPRPESNPALGETPQMQLEHYRAQTSSDAIRPDGIFISRKQLIVGAIVAGGLTFTAILLLRLFL